MRRMFDPDAYRIVLLDQRGAGRSRPHASSPEADLAVNTTTHLIGDLELLRGHLKVERWLLYGISWGSTLALAYAEAHPEQVSEIILAPVTMMRRSGVDWFTRGAGQFFPQEWEAFSRSVPEASRDGDLAAAYAQLLNDPDPNVHEPAARAWCAWEEALVSIESGGVPNPCYDDPDFRLGFARLVTHYFSHAAWLGETQLLDQAHRLAGIPGVLIHGRLDLGGPLVTARGTQPGLAWQPAHRCRRCRPYLRRFRRARGHGHGPVSKRSERAVSRSRTLHIDASAAVPGDSAAAAT
jgi:proline iminopeptidase